VALALPLATWPGLAAPFSTPKRWLLAGAVIALLPLPVWRAVRLRVPRHAGPAPNGSKDGRGNWRHDVGLSAVPPTLQVVLVAWLASFAWSGLAAPAVSPEALVLGIAGPLWCLLIVMAAVPFTRLAAFHVAGTTGVACVGLAQAVGLDPFVWCGWLPVIDGASIRMRVYGTLGNPNFVAALMAISIPLAGGLAMASGGSRRVRVIVALAIVMMAAALAVTGSRAGAIGLACGVVVFAVLLRHRLSRWVIAGAVLVAVVAIVASGGRGTIETLRGRLYIWQTTWAHAWERPITGVGPGAFELYYAGWDDAARASRSAGGRDVRFAGPQQAAHNDYLQALVERGVGGLVTTLLVLATPLLVWRRSRRCPAGAHAALAGAAGAVAACAAVAAFDFPLQRPAEAAVLWMAVALAWQTTGSTPSTTSRAAEGMTS
jgi:O-antigen ligase